MPDYPLNLEVEQKLDGSFVLTLVTKQEYLQPSDEEALLSRLSDILKRAIKGENIALPKAFKSTAAVSQAVCGVDNTETLVPDAEADMQQAGANAITVRKHFAGLSGVEKTNIGLNRPSLFELGLDSIDVMKLATRLRNDGLTIPVSMIMQQPTVAGICSSLKQKHDANQGPQLNSSESTSFDAQQSSYRELLSLSNIKLKSVERILPVTHMQEGLLVDYEGYYHVTAFELDLDVDLQRLEQAWTKVTQKQPILRTSFVAVEDTGNSNAFLQAVHRQDYSAPSIRHYATTDETLEEIANRIGSLARDEGTTGLVLRLQFFEKKEKRFMILGMPHAAYDAWSLHLLHQEVLKVYFDDQIGENGGGVIPYESHLAATLQRASNDEGRSFWRRILQDVKPSIFRNSSKEDVLERPPQFLTRQSNISLYSAVGLCKNVGVTLQSLGLACWTLALAHCIQRLDVCYGLVLAGRTTEGADSLIFPTFNTVLFRSQLAKSETLESFLRKTHEDAIRISGHQHFPLREALKLAGCNNSQFDLFNTLFTYQKIPKSQSDVKKLYHEVDLDDRPRNPPYAVNVEMEGRDNSLWWTIATQEGVMDKEGVETVLATIEQVLEGLLERSDSPVLEEKDGETSICGLIPITLEPQPRRLATSVDHQKAITDEEPWSNVESNIRQVLAEISEVDLSMVQKSTGFYHLGLDSISAIKVAGLLKKRGLKIPVSKIVESQNVKNMARVVETLREHEPGKEQAEQTLVDDADKYSNILNQYRIAAEDVDCVYPATAGQICMLGTWAKSKGVFYPSFWLLVEGVTRQEFDQAMARLVSRIPMLRTTFLNDTIDSEGGIVQVTFSPDTSRRYSLPWSYVAELDDGKLLISLKLHHALYDAVSLQIMITELETLCSADRIQQQELLNIDFRPFLSLTHEIGASKKVQQKNFWTSYLQTATVALAHGSFNVSRIERFNPRLFETSKLKNLLTREGLSIQSLFFAICGRLYARLRSENRQSDEVDHVVIGIYLANRSLDIPDLPSFAAPTLNIVPLKVNISRDVGLLRAAKEVQDDLVQISKAENCGVSLREVYEWTGERLDFVVNFLKVPGSGDDEKDEDEEQDAKQRRVRVRHADGEIKEEMRSMKHDRAAASPFLDDTAPSEAELECCIPTIDIEARLEDGWLGVGIFAPEGMMDEKGLDRLMEEIMERLDGME